MSTMHARTIGLALLVACGAFVGCAKPWYGFGWLNPTAAGKDPNDQGEQMSEMRAHETEMWPTGASDRSREIEARLGVRD